MKKVTIISILAAALTLKAISSDFDSPQETEIVKIVNIQRSLGIIREGSQNIANIYNATNLLHLSDDPHNSDEIKTLEDLVPAAHFIVSNYDVNIIPILLNQAMTSRDIYFKRRVIYCIEKICATSISKVLADRFGEILEQESFKELVENSTVPKRDVIWYFPPLGSEFDNVIKDLKK